MKWTEEHRKNHKLAFEKYKGKDNWNWKEDVGYKSIHEWIRTNYGKPKVCEICGSDAKEWAKREGHNYSRNREDWIELCRSCHKTYDKIILNITNHCENNT